MKNVRAVMIGLGLGTGAGVLLLGGLFLSAANGGRKVQGVASERTEQETTSPQQLLSTGATPDSVALNQAFTVAEAYELIPHQRTSFSLASTAMDDSEAQQLAQFFKLTDGAVVERVAHQRALQAGALAETSFENYEIILSQITALTLPQALDEPKQLIVAAIEEQQAYFEGWRQSGDPQFYESTDPLIQSSHRKLIKAYQQIMRAYPHASEHNKTAFFDHLCALDFI